jgi:uncharacterized protein
MTLSAGGSIAAQWRDLLMISFEVDPLVLVPLVPNGTSLDFHAGKSLVTVVGLRLFDVRVGDAPATLNRPCERVELRSYVWRQAGSEIRAGIIVLKEIVATEALAVGVSALFDGPTVAAPMQHRVAAPGQGGAVSYSWYLSGRWNQASAMRGAASVTAPAGSIEAFVKDRGWRYMRRAAGATAEWRIEHPSWEIWSARDARLDCDVATVYGRQLEPALSGTPLSVFVATGSEAVTHPLEIVD